LWRGPQGDWFSTTEFAVVAGRSYVTAAYRAAAADPTARPLHMDDWMQPAVTRGLWLATAAAAAILIVGFASVSLAARRGQRRLQPPVINRGSLTPEPPLADAGD